MEGRDGGDEVCGRGGMVGMRCVGGEGWCGRR